jgi:DNA-binding response OmpR family regulator
MNRILIVEDEHAMLMGLKDNLEIEGYSVDVAPDGALGLEKILKNDYDLVLLDVMLPNMSGFDVCKNARLQGIDTPIILLTAKGEEIDKVLGLELGADDYMTKPFSLKELLARIKAILRRTERSVKPSSDKIQIGKMEFIFSNYEAFAEGEPVKLSHKEFEFIQYLWTNKNKVVSRDELLENVWAPDYMPSPRTIDNFVLKFRQKIEDDINHPKIILTVHGVGYKLVIQ